MNYMQTVPYYATTQISGREALDFAPQRRDDRRSPTGDLPGFGVRFNADLLGTACSPVKVGMFDPSALRGEVFGENGDRGVMILRMCVKRPGSGFRIPADFAPLLPLLTLAAEDHLRTEMSPDGFVYLTIRFGTAASSDHTWHTDGFQSGKKQNLKVPEVNYIWANSEPTLFYDGPVDLSDVDFGTTNVHSAIHARVEADLASASPQGRAFAAEVCGVYAMNPFVIHRKPAAVASGFRRFVRMTFCETEIQDDTCAANPLLPMPRYGNRDARWALNG